MGDEDDSLLLFPSEPLGEAGEDESDHEDCKILDPPEQWNVYHIFVLYGYYGYYY